MVLIFQVTTLLKLWDIVFHCCQEILLYTSRPLNHHVFELSSAWILSMPTTLFPLTVTYQLHTTNNTACRFNNKISSIRYYSKSQIIPEKFKPSGMSVFYYDSNFSWKHIKVLSNTNEQLAYSVHVVTTISFPDWESVGQILIWIFSFSCSKASAVLRRYFYQM